MSDPLNSLLYEHMLMQRHVVHSTGPYGRQAHLDSGSATLLLARLKAEGPMTVAQLSVGFGLQHPPCTDSSPRQPNTDLSKRSVTPKAEQPGSINHPRRELDDEEEFEARHTTSAAITSGWTDDDVRTFAELMRRFNEKVEDQRGQPWPRRVTLPADPQQT